MGSEGAKGFSAVEGQLGAREPDLWAGRLSFLSAFSHMDSEVSRLLPSQTVTPLSPGRGGARAGAAGVQQQHKLLKISLSGVRRAGVRDVCGTERAMCLCPPFVCLIITETEKNSGLSEKSRPFAIASHG